MKVGIFGANGRMGRVLIEAVQENEHTTLTLATVRDDSPWIGMNVGDVAGVRDQAVHCIGISEIKSEHVDVMIDFTLPAAFDHNLSWCLENHIPIVIGTTGLTQAQENKLAHASKSIPIVYAANYSVGVNVMLSLVRQAAKALGDTADIEITEAHHREKLDSPSGTAIALGKVIADELERDLQQCAIYGREGKSAPRNQQTIGFSTIRGGDIALFADIGERLEITHKASSRFTFAKGAVQAAVWLNQQQAGLYSMKDVIGLDS
jgi:4-hydroxy-tetrahydrodipicolinate reductase